MGRLGCLTERRRTVARWTRIGGADPNLPCHAGITFNSQCQLPKTTPKEPFQPDHTQIYKAQPHTFLYKTRFLILKLQSRFGLPSPRGFWRDALRHWAARCSLFLIFTPYSRIDPRSSPYCNVSVIYMTSMRVTYAEIACEY